LTEVAELDVEAAKAKAEELKAPGKFDLGDALKGASYPTEAVSIFLNGELAHELNINYDRIAELAQEALQYKAGNNGGMADGPEKEPLDAEIAELEATNRELLAEISKSVLKFQLRGVAPEQWKLIIKKWQREMKKHFTLPEEQLEAEEWANAKIDAELVAKATIKITNAEGAEDTSALTVEKSEQLAATVLQSEWAKLLGAANNLTFANGLFAQAIAADADFLSKSSLEQISAGI
jgi:ferritin-like protein